MDLHKDLKLKIKRSRKLVASYKIKKITKAQMLILEGEDDEKSEKLFKTLVAEDVIEIRQIALKELDRLARLIELHPYCKDCLMSDAYFGINKKVITNAQEYRKRKSSSKRTLG